MTDHSDTQANPTPVTDSGAVSVLSLQGAIEQVTHQLNGLFPNVGHDDQKALRKIIHLWDKGVVEINGDGLTLESCQKMVPLLIAGENSSRERVLGGGTKQDLNMYEGVRRTHDIMGLISKQQGINEGNKDDCCPFCSGC